MRLVTRACLIQEQQLEPHVAGSAAIWFLHTHAAPGTAIILPERASLALRYHCKLPSQRGRNLAAIGADYFLIPDSPGYQGTLDTGTAASNLTWEGWLHTG